jgi:hypothetical protein
MGMESQLVGLSIVLTFQMYETNVLAELNNIFMGGIVLVREDIDLLSKRTKFAGQLTDVNTHTTSISCTELAYGTGMNADHCDSELVCFQLNQSSKEISSAKSGEAKPSRLGPQDGHHICWG